MLDDRSRTEVRAVARTTGIIVFGLCSGVIAFAGYLLVFHQRQAPPQMGMMTLACFGMAGVSTIASVAIPPVLIHAGRKGLATKQPNKQVGVQTDAGRLAMVYLQATIVGSAMLEGAAFFALIAYMIEGHTGALIVALAMLVGIGIRFPFGDRLLSWVETQIRTAEQDGQFSALKR